MERRSGRTMGKGGVINLGAKEPPSIGDWEVDEMGRRYRMVGDCKEYEMLIRIDGIEIPYSQLDEYHERKERWAKTHQDNE